MYQSQCTLILIPITMPSCKLRQFMNHSSGEAASRREVKQMVVTAKPHQLFQVKLTHLGQYSYLLCLLKSCEDKISLLPCSLSSFPSPRSYSELSPHPYLSLASSRWNEKGKPHSFSCSLLVRKSFFFIWKGGELVSAPQAIIQRNRDMQGQGRRSWAFSGISNKLS